MENSVGPDQTALSDLGLLCLPRPSLSPQKLRLLILTAIMVNFYSSCTELPLNIPRISTVNFLNIRTPKKFVVITLKFELCGSTIE